MHVDWHKYLNDQTIRDYLDPMQFASLASRIGITPETTLVFYGDESNWWACYALWVFALFGHKVKSLLFLLPVMVLHTAEAAVQKQGNSYTVQSGDTLFDIAQAYYKDGNQWQKIAQANNIDVNNPIIRVGDKLTIPDMPQ